jgi:transcriptional regulator with XRE-family HTH domain
VRAGVLLAFGANVRRQRLGQQLTQEGLAEKAELDMTYVSGIERGKRNPTVLVIAKLTLALDTDAGVLCRDITPRQIKREGAGSVAHAA